MLSIRLSRIGKTNSPLFRVVVMDKRKSAKGRALEVLGSVNPPKKEKILNKERILYWISVGAKPSERVHNMLIAEKIIEGKKLKKKMKTKKKAEGTETSTVAPIAEAAPEVATPPIEKAEEKIVEVAEKAEEAPIVEEKKEEVEKTEEKVVKKSEKAEETK